MPNYGVSVHGSFTPELKWSFGARMNSASDLPTVLAAWHNAWVLAWTDATNGLQQFYPVATTMDYTRAALLDSTGHETQNQINEESHAGTATGDTLPYLNSIIVSERSAFSAKWDRGRFYLPALEETFVNNNVLIPAAGNKIQTVITGVFNAITAGGNTVYVQSRKLRKGDPPTALPYAPVTIIQWKVSNKPARQSRRVKKQVATYFA
jgi:hypothetical protein